MINWLLASIEITRPHNMLIATLGVAAGYVISGGDSPAAVWPTALFTALVTGAGNIINDYYDLRIDAVNKPHRPLPSGRITPGAALVLYAAATVSIAVGAFVFLPPRVAVLMVFWQLALYVYARRVKRAFVIGNLLVAVVTSSVFLAGALVTGNVSAAAVPMSIAIVFVVCRELVKGAEDVEGDRAAGVFTVAVVMGTARTVLAASVLMLVLVVAIPAPGLTGHFGAAYLWAMEFTVVPGLLAAAHLTLSRPVKRTFGRVSWLLKIEMFFGVLAMGAGKL